MGSALCIIGLLAGCLHESSSTCGSGSVCPPGLQCADTGDDQLYCILATCGNGQVDPGERCDDRNTYSGDGCPADCTAPCGDGKLDPREVCDDGNTRPEDGCPADCTAPCGDGSVDPDEVCDDGNTTDGDNCSGNCQFVDGISLVSPGAVTFTAIEGEVLPAAITVRVRVPFSGDIVFVGHTSGVPQPSWLSITPGATTALTAEFQFQVTDTTVAGSRSTSVRFTVQHVGVQAQFFDLPVTYNVEVSDLGIGAAPAALAFTAVASGAVPAAQSIQVTFNGADAAVLAVPSWMTVSIPPAPMTSPAVFDLAVNSTAFAADTTLSGDVVFRTTRGTLTRTAAVHVAYNLVETGPDVQFVAPYMGIAGQGGMLRVRGRAFQWMPGPVTVGVALVAMTSSLDDSTVFVSGDSKLLVVPVN